MAYTAPIPELVEHDGKTLQIEVPTLGLILLDYLLIALVIGFYPVAPMIGAIALTILLAFHTSLVHEIIHGHPTSSRKLNDLLGSPPLTLIFPYPVFRESHLAHHRDELLTLPGIDPESYFYSEQEWQRMHSLRRAIAWCNMTLLGRLLLNPLNALLEMVLLCVDSLRNGDRTQRWMWIRHLGACALLLVAIALLDTIPVWTFLACVYGSHALISLRSFFEHRPEELVAHRIAVVESGRLLSLLFLNNNYHATHHRYPGLPWYEVESRFREEGGSVVERNGGFHFNGYRAWLRFLVRPVASPIHPFADQ